MEQRGAVKVGEERCVCCGEIIPEGTQVCQRCSNKPVPAELEGGGCSWWYVCGECHGEIDWKDKICPHCKTPVKWE